tara:strand:+ start:43 stop:183 length:141 start_codon:yes stop_codon:yes gene_type:complete
VVGVSAVGLLVVVEATVIAGVVVSVPPLHAETTSSTVTAIAECLTV